MKRQQNWQASTAKKGKQVADTSADNKASTGAKSFMVEKLFLQGNIVGPKANAPVSIDTKTFKQNTTVPTAQRRTKHFANTVVKDWYNQKLKQQNEEMYDKINGCFRALQSNDLRASNYWLTQIEQMVLRTQFEMQEIKDQ